MRVLVVEDSERLQRALSAGLRGAGFAVDLAADGAEGRWHAETLEHDVDDPSRRLTLVLWLATERARAPS